MTTTDPSAPRPDDELPDAATPEQGKDALVSGKADAGGAPPGDEDTVLEGLGRAIGNIVIGSLPDPGPRDGVASRERGDGEEAK